MFVLCAQRIQYIIYPPGTYFALLCPFQILHFAPKTLHRFHIEVKFWISLSSGFSFKFPFRKMIAFSLYRTLYENSMHPALNFTIGLEIRNWIHRSSYKIYFIKQEKTTATAAAATASAKKISTLLKYDTNLNQHIYRHTDIKCKPFNIQRCHLLFFFLLIFFFIDPQLSSVRVWQSKIWLKFTFLKVKIV